MLDRPIHGQDPVLDLVPDWIDEVADQFEAAWRKLTPPRIDDFLGDETGERRAALLMELIQLDLACRARIGSQRSLAHYGDEFPEIRQRLATDIAQPTPLPQKLVPQKVITDLPNIAGYEILGELGEGGMGVVYKARRIRLGRVEALKMILAGPKARRRDLSRFQTEMEAVARLQHPNIVQLYDVGEHEGQPYCALEYVDGGNLAQRLAGTPQPPRQAAQLVETLARAIHVAHQQNVIHRDLKPANVLLGTDGTPKISDFGLAKQLTEAEAPLKHVTYSGEIIGTPSYMAPEQAQGKPQEVGAPADIYGLGAILYELLTGRPPFKGETMEGTLEQVRTQEPVAPSRLQPKLPGDLTTICLKCLEKDPGKRYPSAEALAKDLRRFLDGKPIHARSVSNSERLWRWCRRNPLIAVPSAAAGVLLVGLVVVLSVSTLLVWRANHGLSESLERERQNAYYQRIALAEREWSANRLERVQELLAQCPEDLRGWEWHYLKRLVLNTIPPLRHPVPVLSAVFSPDGRWIATGGLDGAVRIWDAITGQLRFDFPAHTDHVRKVTFSHDGRRLATASWDKTAKIWDFDPQRSGVVLPLIRTLGGEYKVQSVAFSPDNQRLALVGEDKNLRIWDAATGRQSEVLPGASSGIQSVAYSHDGQYLATADYDKTVKILDAGTGREKLTLPHRAYVWSLSFSRDGHWLVSTTGDLYTKVNGEINVWDASTGEQVRTLRGHTTRIVDATFSPDGKRLASAGKDGNVKLWDLQTGQEILTLREHRGVVYSVAFSPDGTRLVSASTDGTARIWDATPLRGETGQESLTLKSDCAAVYSVGFSPDGYWLASVGDDGNVRLWDYQRARLGGADHPIRTLVGGKGYGRIVFSHSGQLLALGGGVGRNTLLKVWATNTWELVYSLEGNWPLALVFSPDDKYLATCSSRTNSTIEIRDAKNGEETCPRLQGHSWAILDMAFSPNPEFPRLASAGDRTVRIWDLRTGKEVVASLQHSSNVLCTAFSHDGRVLASGGLDRVVKIWDAGTWKFLRDLADPTGAVQSVAFHPKDSRVLAWGGTDGTVKVWNSATEEVRTFHGHTSWVESVAYSPDGQWLASGSLDGTVKLWQAPR